MAYSAALELFGAIERGRLDPPRFQQTCKLLLSCLAKLNKPEIHWLIDVDHVYVESDNEESLFNWISTLYRLGINQETSNTLPWVIKGLVVEGRLGIILTTHGLSTSDAPGVFAELRSSMRHFHAAGIRIDYFPESNFARSIIFSNIMWTGYKDIPYLLFTDIKETNPDSNSLERIQRITEVAISVSRYSKPTSRNYISAITRILINNNDWDIKETISVLATAKSVDGIEITGLIIVDRYYENKTQDIETIKKLIEFPRLKQLVQLLQEKHAIPIGLIKKDAVSQFLNSALWSPSTRRTD
ncbi:hypothetical protein [Plasticicumulans sp.]|uniref:hypothetical protein n=1 Tax=Plasticicumulans sp. TaxID=2307179 RepID=UPI0032202951